MKYERYKFDPNQGPGCLSWFIMLNIIWWFCVCVGLEMEREGAWLLGLVFDHVLLSPNLVDIYTVFFLVVASSPIWGLLIFLYWMSR